MSFCIVCIPLKIQSFLRSRITFLLEFLIGNTCSPSIQKRCNFQILRRGFLTLVVYPTSNTEFAYASWAITSIYPPIMVSSTDRGREENGTIVYRKSNRNDATTTTTAIPIFFDTHKRTKRHHPRKTHTNVGRYWYKVVSPFFGEEA